MDRLSDLRMTENHLAVDRLQHSLDRGGDLLDTLINDTIGADIHALQSRRIQRRLIGTYIEAHDDGVGSGCQHDVSFDDTADAGMDDIDFYFFVAKLLKRRLDCLRGALHVRLDDDIEILHAVAHLRKEVVEIDLCIGLENLFLFLLAALLGKLLRHTLILDGAKLVARRRNRIQSDDFHRHGGACGFDLLALVVAHRAHTSDGRTDDNGIARVKRAVLNENGRNRTAAAVEFRLDHDTFGAAVRIRLKLFHFRDKQDHLKKLRDSLFGECGNGNADRIAAPFLRHQIVFRQLLLDCLRIGAGLVDLVDRHNDGNARRLRVVDRLHRLRHDAVVGGDDKNRNIRGLRASRAHRRKRFVSRRVSSRGMRRYAG